MIYKRFGNSHIKLQNNELEKLFDIRSEAKLDDTTYLKNIMTNKVLLPISKIVESPEQ